MRILAKTNFQSIIILASNSSSRSTAIVANWRLTVAFVFVSSAVTLCIIVKNTRENPARHTFHVARSTRQAVSSPPSVSRSHMDLLGPDTGESNVPPISLKLWWIHHGVLDHLEVRTELLKGGIVGGVRRAECHFCGLSCPAFETRTPAARYSSKVWSYCVTV